MTCIVGYVDKSEDCVYIGADSLGSSSFSGIVRKDPKFFHYTKDIIVGFTSSYRMGQVIMYAENLFSDININNKEFFTHKNMVTKFIPNLVKLYKDIDDTIDKKGTFLIATFDKLWKIYDDFQVEETVQDFNSCGSGEDFAFGSLYTSEKNEELSITDKIILSLESAENYAKGVQRPFHIVNTRDENTEVIT